MLSKTEQEFLRNPSNFNSNYQRSLRCRLEGKAEKLGEELSLLKSTGIADNFSNAPEFCSVGQSPNQIVLMNQGGMWSLRRDLDPRFTLPK